MPNSWAAAIAMSRAEAMSCETSQLTRCVLRSRALAIASSMADSSTRPSSTSRCGSPVRTARTDPAAAALSFNDPLQTRLTLSL